MAFDLAKSKVYTINNNNFTPMDKTHLKSPWTILVIIVVAMAVWGLFRFKPSSPGPRPEPGPSNNSQTNTQGSGQTLSGTLQASNNPARGNLMLMTDKQTIYISTSRDYSALIGKTVVVSYDGTLDNFRLGDIIAK